MGKTYAVYCGWDGTRSSGFWFSGTGTPEVSSSALPGIPSLSSSSPISPGIFQAKIPRPPTTFQQEAALWVRQVVSLKQSNESGLLIITQGIIYYKTFRKTLVRFPFQPDILSLF